MIEFVFEFDFFLNSLLLDLGLLDSFHPFLLFRLQDHFPNLSEAHSEHDIEVAEYDYQSDSNRDVEWNLICEDLVARHDPTVNEHHVA